MQNKKHLVVRNGIIEVTVNEMNDTKMSLPELSAEAILMLLSGLDIKEYEGIEAHEKFDTYINRILEEIHGLCKWAGWQESE